MNQGTYSHTDQYWKHEIDQAFAKGYQIGRDSGYKEGVKDAHAKQEQGEPVAWIHEDERIGYRALEWKENVLGYRGVWKKIPLYTTPPQRTWVGLTDEEADELWESTDSDLELMKRVEAKLKEKNT